MGVLNEKKDVNVITDFTYQLNSIELISLNIFDKSKFFSLGLNRIILFPNDVIYNSLIFSFSGSLSLWLFSSHSITNL
jgi:hypothetical protein